MAPHTQKALVLESKQGAWKVVDFPVPKPGPGEILVKTAATALNPVDWKIQAYGIISEKFPAVVGTDGAGTVEALGEGVTTFKVGDKILTQGLFDNDHATFQQYFATGADIAALIPSNISFDQAASVPLGLATAALGLFNQESPSQTAGLTPPWEEGGEGKYAGKPLLVFGGSTSVGQYVIQLGRLAGFSPIIATASLHNTDLVKSLGATHVIDRHLSGDALVAEVKKITTEPIPIAYDSVSFKDTQIAGYSLLAPGGTLVIVLDEAVEGKTPDKKIAHVFGNVHPPFNRKLGQSLYAKLTSLLEKGVIKPNHIDVLKNGLAGIPDGLARLQADKVSGQKLIARPQETA